MDPFNRRKVYLYNIYFYCTCLFHNALLSDGVKLTLRLKNGRFRMGPTAVLHITGM